MPARILSSPHREMLAKAVVRSCLRCRQEFKSLGPANRICEKCNEKNLTHAKRKEKG